MLPSGKPKASPPDDSLNDFIVSARNELALAAARNACKSEPDQFFLVIHGATDSGKSHLLGCIRHSLVSALGNDAIFHARATAFCPWQDPEHFWSSSRALLLDDLQEMSIRQQRRLVAYMDAAFQSKCWHRMVFTVFGQTMPAFEERLAARLKKALTVELYQADLSARIAWIEKMANPALHLNRKQILTLARHANHISALNGLLQKLEFYANLTGHILTPEELEKISAPADHPAAWRVIINQVGKRLALSPNDILGTSRRHEFVVARQIAMFLCRHKLGLSYPELGRLFGGKDHSTVMHGIKKIEYLRHVDKDMHILLTELENEDF